MKSKLILFFAVYLLLLTPHVYAFVAAPTEDVKNTRHNLSSSGPTERSVFTTQTTEICVFCHTPHGSNPDAVSFGAPIWNRRLSAETYTMYDQVWSKSFEGQLNSTLPTGFSRLCLSCHDGTIALSRLINPPGSGGFVRFDDATSTLQSFSMTYQNSQTSGCVGADCIPIGAGVTTGDTRLLGVDLRNDHAISFVFDSILSSLAKDDELQQVNDGIDLGSGVSLTQPGVDLNLSPLKRHVGNNPNRADSVQCTSCHNPHQVDFPKFLRANRLQTDFAVSIGSGTRPAPGANPNTAIICVFCHDKPGVPYGKSDGSTIANAGFDYTEVDPVSGLPKGLSTHFTDPTLLKDGATDLAGTTADQISSSIINPTPTQVAVRQRACLACHDPHTEQGSIRLLRAGADNSIDTTAYPSENSPTVAIEQTCYMCHSPTSMTFNIIDAASCTANPGDCPPDVMTQFRKDLGTPAASSDDPAFLFPEASLSQAYPTGENVTDVNGSAMNLRLGVGHQPVFTNLPREGVQLGDENPQAGAPGFVPPLIFGAGPNNTYDTPNNLPGGGGDVNKKISDLSVSNVADTRHIECVDCHNMHRVNRTNRFRGMPGVTIDLDDTSGGSTLLVSQTLNTVGTGCDGNTGTPNSCRREPFIFEICLRCHGNSFNQHIGEQRVRSNGTGLVVQFRGNNPVSSFSASNDRPWTPNPTSTALGGGSNKRKEFDPNAKPYYVGATPKANSTGQLQLNNAAECGTGNPPLPSCNNGLPAFNTSFHPVATLGRNQSGVLNNVSDSPVGQLRGQDANGNRLSRSKTIHCTDCHNSNLFGTYGGSFIASGGIPDFPGPITFDNTRGEPYKRSTDLGRNGAAAFTNTLLNDPTKPQGPHGSIWRRILRSNYQTLLAPNEGSTTTQDSYDSQNFALCFNCHNEAAFTTKEWNTSNERLTNFYRQGTGNLHWLHLIDRAKARCHECHSNVHSNIESGNTLYVNITATGIGANNPGHENSTHLINFAPEVAVNLGSGYSNPIWGNGAQVNPSDNNSNGPGCNLRCHDFDMEHNYDAHSVINGGKCVDSNGCGK